MTPYSGSARLHPRLQTFNCGVCGTRFATWAVDNNEGEVVSAGRVQASVDQGELGHGRRIDIFGFSERKRRARGNVGGQKDSENNRQVDESSCSTTPSNLIGIPTPNPDGR